VNLQLFPSLSSSLGMRICPVTLKASELTENCFGWQDAGMKKQGVVLPSVRDEKRFLSESMTFNCSLHFLQVCPTPK